MSSDRWRVAAVGSGSDQPSREDLAAQIREVEQLIAEQSGASTHGEGVQGPTEAIWCPVPQIRLTSVQPYFLSFTFLMFWWFLPKADSDSFKC